MFTTNGQRIGICSRRVFIHAEWGVEEVTDMGLWLGRDTVTPGKQKNEGNLPAWFYNQFGVYLGRWAWHLFQRGRRIGLRSTENIVVSPPIFPRSPPLPLGLIDQVEAVLKSRWPSRGNKAICGIMAHRSICKQLRSLFCLHLRIHCSIVEASSKWSWPFH